MCSGVFLRVSRDECQTVLQSRRGNYEIRLREGVSRLSAVLHQQSPLQHDVLRDRQDSLEEHRPNLVGQPFGQFSPPPGIGKQFDAEPYLGKCYDANMQALKRLSLDESDDFCLRSGTTKLRQHVRIEQPARHRWISRTGNRDRSGSISTSRYGDACMAATSALPVRSPLRRRNSSAAITTTSSRP